MKRLFLRGPFLRYCGCSREGGGKRSNPSPSSQSDSPPLSRAQREEVQFREDRGLGHIVQQSGEARHADKVPVFPSLSSDIPRQSFIPPSGNGSKKGGCGLKIATTYLGYFSRSVVFEMLFLFPLALNEKDIYAVDEKRRALRAKKNLCT